MIDKSKHFDNYQIKIPKEAIKSMILKELNKLYPTYRSLSEINKVLIDLEKRVRMIESVIV